MKGFKAFNKGMICRGFKYEEGKEYKIDGDVEICSHGFHSCENPLDTLSYYDLVESEFAEVEMLGKTEKQSGKNADSKVVTDHIKIVKKIAIREFVDASINYFST